MVVVIFSTSWNIPFSALNGVISPYPEERASFSSHRIFISSLACSLATAIFMPLAMKFGLNEGNAVRGYLVAAIIVCAIAIPFVFTAVLGTKEVVAAPPAEKKEKFSAKLIWNAFSKNPPLLIVCFAFLVYGFLNYGRMTVGMYYFTYVWGNVNLFTVYATFNGIFAAVGGFCGAFFVKLFKGKRGALLFAYGMQAILNLATYFMLPTNSSSTLILALLFLMLMLRWANMRKEAVRKQAQERYRTEFEHEQSRKYADQLAAEAAVRTAAKAESVTEEPVAETPAEDVIEEKTAE